MIISLECSPFIPGVFLSLGDWTFTIGKLQTSADPSFVSPCARAIYTAGAWSPSRPGKTPSPHLQVAVLTAETVRYYIHYFRYVVRNSCFEIVFLVGKLMQTVCVAGVLYLARADGVLEVWDLLEASHQPTASIPVAAVGLTSLAVNLSALAGAPSNRSLIAIGEPHLNRLPSQCPPKYPCISMQPKR